MSEPWTEEQEDRIRKRAQADPEYVEAIWPGTSRWLATLAARDRELATVRALAVKWAEHYHSAAGHRARPFAECLDSICRERRAALLPGAAAHPAPAEGERT